MWKHVLFAGILISLAWSGEAEEFTLAHGGTPSATIVVEKDASSLVTQAAQDLQHYVKAICDVELPLVTDGKALAGIGIYIGSCEPTRVEILPPKDSNPETYAIALRGGNLFLCGNHGPATSYAVVSFIEDAVGVRWFAPGELWESVPAGTAGELTVDVKNRVVTPDWSVRVWSGHQWVTSWKEWNRRNKTLSAPPVPFRNMQNVMHGVISPKKYGETHPEYFPLINGKRRIPEEGYRNWRPCESNPDVLRITVETARAYLDAHPEHNSFSVAMDDIYRLCSCENCRALDAAPDDYEHKRFSDRHYKFVNAVARELQKTHPDKYVGTLCYHIARELPKTVDKLEPNVFISMTQRVGEWWRPERRGNDMALTKEWRKRCEHMSRYGYLGLGFITPRVYPHAMAEGMKFDHELGFESVYNECYVILPNVAPMVYMIAKLQWDTSLDADELLNEFYDSMFGEAAGYMRECYNTLERSYMEARPERLAMANWGHRNLRTHSLAVSVSDLDKAEAFLAKARNATDDARILKRIDIVAASIRYGGYIIRSGDLARRIADAPIETSEEAQDILKQFQALAALSQERVIFWQEAIERDDILGESLRGLRNKGYFCINQMPQVISPATAALGNAIGVLQDKSSLGSAERFVEQLGDIDQDTIGALGSALIRASRGELDNRLVNGGFDETQGDSDTAAADWSTSGAPRGWYTWQRTPVKGCFVPLQKEGRARTCAAAIRGNSGSCYIQSRPVKPGERYLCVAWAKTSGADMRAGAGLKVRFRTPSDEWHPNRELEPAMELPVGPEYWQCLHLLATVPEGAGHLVLMLSAEGMREGTTLLFDDAALYSLKPRE